MSHSGSGSRSGSDSGSRSGSGGSRSGSGSRSVSSSVSTPRHDHGVLGGDVSHPEHEVVIAGPKGPDPLVVAAIDFKADPIKADKMETMPLKSSPAAGKRHWLKYVWVSYFYIGMGITGIALCWTKLHEVSHQIPVEIGYAVALFSALLMSCLLLVYLLKAIMFPLSVLAEIRHPVRANYFSLIFQNLILYSWVITYIPVRNFSIVLWTIATFGQGILTIYVLGKWFDQKQKTDEGNPAVFIPITGDLLVALGGAQLGIFHITWFFFACGILFWIVMFTHLFATIVFRGPLPIRMTPNLFWIIAAPAIGGLAYESLYGPFSFYYFLVFVSFVMVILMARIFTVWLRVSFGPMWWAYIFPLSSVCIAAGEWALTVKEYIKELDFSNSSDANIHAVDRIGSRIWFIVLLGIATGAGILVLLRFVWGLFKKELLVEDD